MSDTALNIVTVGILFVLLGVAVCFVGFAGEQISNAGTIPGWYEEHATKDALILGGAVLAWGAGLSWAFIEVWRTR